MAQIREENNDNNHIRILFKQMHQEIVKIYGRQFYVVYGFMILNVQDLEAVYNIKLAAKYFNNFLVHFV